MEQTSTEQQETPADCTGTAQWRFPLSRVIQSVEQVQEMSTEALESLLGRHEAEALSLQGAIESGLVESGARARQAERTLRLHKSWIDRELKARRYKHEKDSIRQEREAKAQAHRQALEQANAAKMERIAASNDENIRQMAAFKAVVLEAVGTEKYLALWNQVRLRMGETPLRNGQSAHEMADAEREHLGDPDKQTGIYARQKCTLCGGIGVYGMPGKRCSHCDGKGSVPKPPIYNGEWIRPEDDPNGMWAAVREMTSKGMETPTPD